MESGLSLRPHRSLYFIARTAVVLLVSLGLGGGGRSISRRQMTAHSSNAALRQGDAGVAGEKPSAQPPLDSAIKNVLIINSETQDAPVFAAQERQIRSVLSSALKDGVQCFTEYMDQTRLNHTGYLESLADLLHQKYISRRIDLEVTIGPEALPFIMQYGDKVSAGAPVVFSYPDTGFLKKTDLPGNISGFAAPLEVGRTLELILLLHPDTQRVAIVLGPSTRPNLASDLASVRAQTAPFITRTTFTFIGEAGIGAVTREVSNLPPGVPVVYIYYVPDKEEAFVSAVTAAAMVAGAAQGPVYCVNDEYFQHLGQGIVGGFLTSDSDYQARIARLALHTLEPASQPLPSASPSSRYAFDERQLKRWNIDPRKLPPGSEIRFHEPTAWERYRRWVIGAAAVIILQALLIAALIIHRAKRKQAETALHDSRKLALLQLAELQSIYATAPVGLCFIDTSLRYVSINERMAEINGLPAVQHLGRTVREVLPQLADELEPIYARVIASGLPIVDREVRRAAPASPGVERDWLASYYPIGDGGQIIGINIVAQDITARKRAEETLRESEERFRSAFNYSAIGMALVARDGRWLQVNPALCEMLGYTEEAMLATSFQALTHPDDLGADLAYTNQLWAGQIPHFGMEKRYLHKRGHTVWVLLSRSVVRDASGHPVYGIAQVQDITERKRSDEALRNARADLAQVTRAMALGELAASIAHEINQPLCAILTNANVSLDWLNNGTRNPDHIREALLDVIQDCERAGEVIRRIRGFLKKGPAQPAPFDLNDAITEVIKLLRTELNRNRVSVETHLADGLPLLVGDRIQLQQVILNLVVNGIEAMSGVDAASRRLVLRSLQENGTISVEVRDYGVGLDPDCREQIFDSFYSTKPDGMGMGLKICRSIIEAHGGCLRATSDPPGTTLKFTLPVV